VSRVQNLLGLYEKALPKAMPWQEKLVTAKKLGFDFMEISIDESDERLDRLDWSGAERQNLRRAMDFARIPLLSMCFSGHRKYPLGSRDPLVRRMSLELMEKAVQFAVDMGVRVIQMAGYDVYYEEGGEDTREWFIEGLRAAAALAASRQVMLGIEIMDTPFLNSIRKYMVYDRLINSPWLAVYPDIGNLSAWGHDVNAELELGFSRIVGIHVKETLRVSDTCAGAFRDIPFGQGEVEFTSIFRKLKQLNYRGPLVMEMWGDGLADAQTEIVRSRNFILDRLKEGGF
jgi:L-ribulose-5-phosphate 3-epimerase